MDVGCVEGGACGCGLCRGVEPVVCLLLFEAIPPCSHPQMAAKCVCDPVLEQTRHIEEEG